MHVATAGGVLIRVHACNNACRGVLEAILVCWSNSKHELSSHHLTERTCQSDLSLRLCNGIDMSDGHAFVLHCVKIWLYRPEI